MLYKDTPAILPLQKTGMDGFFDSLGNRISMSHLRAKGIRALVSIFGRPLVLRDFTGRLLRSWRAGSCLWWWFSVSIGMRYLGIAGVTILLIALNNDLEPSIRVLPSNRFENKWGEERYGKSNKRNTNAPVF